MKLKLNLHLLIPNQLKEKTKGKVHNDCTDISESFTMNVNVHSEFLALRGAAIGKTPSVQINCPSFWPRKEVLLYWEF